MKLMILPHAGGSARGYCTLKKYLPTEIALMPLEPAGRGGRVKEACFEDLSLCVADILNHYDAALWENDYALFGHSMGTLLVTELARQLSEQGAPSPKHVFLSGRCAADEPIHLLQIEHPTDEEVVTFFAHNDLIPASLLQNKEMYQMFSKVLGADVRMTGAYQLSPKQYQFPCDISIFYGTEDPFLMECGIEGWRRFTNCNCEITSFPGGHFYYTEQKEAVCAKIVETLLR